MNERIVPIIPNEILQQIFLSQNNNHQNILSVSLVCKNWNVVANKNELWQLMIRPEFRSQYEVAGAKDFYKNNIDARIGTYYLIGLSVETFKLNHFTGRGLSIDVDKKTLLQAFPNNQTLQVFDSHSKAVKWADVLSKADETALNTTLSYIYHYHPVFTILLNETPVLQGQFDAISMEREFKFYASGRGEPIPDYKYKCLEINSSQVIKLYSVFHKTGTLLFSERPHVLALNDVPQKKEKEICRIQ